MKADFITFQALIVGAAIFLVILGKRRFSAWWEAKRSYRKDVD